MTTRATLAVVLLATACASDAANVTEVFLEELRQKVATAEAAGETVIAGDDGLLFFVPELRTLSIGPFWGDAATAVGRASKPEDRDPRPAIVDLARQLKERGIELLFVPVPAKASIYPEAIASVELPSPPPRLDRHIEQFYDLLRADGVDVLDLLPIDLAARAAGAPLHLKQDTHWSGRGVVVAAEAIAAHVAGRPWLEEHERTSYATEEREVTIAGDLWNKLPEPRPPRETVTLTHVGTRTAAGLEPIADDRTSPVLLLGDSHTLVFHAGGDLHAKGAGLADHLARKFGFPLDVIGVRGSGATPSRVNLRRRKDGLTAKKLIIWCMSVRELTEASAWKVFPIAK